MTWEKVIEQAKQYKGTIYGIDLNLKNLFTKTFCYYLEKYNVTQLSIARALNVVPVTVNNWAKRRSCPNLKTIIKIKEHFDKLEASETQER